MRELMSYLKMPIIAMVRQGHCSLREEDSLSQGQVSMVNMLSSYELLSTTI